MELTAKEIEIIQRSRDNNLSFKGMRLTIGEEKQILNYRISTLTNHNTRLNEMLAQLKHELHLAKGRSHVDLGTLVRSDPEIYYDAGSAYGEMIDRPDGEWVRFSDVEKLIG